MKNLIIGLFVLGLTTQIFSQNITLPEVEIAAVNYKYLNAVDSDNIAVNVKMLQEKVALYDVKKSDLYVDDYSTYTVTFYIPEGKILAAYDKKGKLIRTIEKFKDVRLPAIVINSIAKRFPNWAMNNDVYRVEYHSDKGATKKQYKVKITNGEFVQTIKVNENGEFL
jgi:hypothetical protein